MELGLVGYSGGQRNESCRPRQLYDPTPLFRLARSYCEQNHDEWLILSAKHGVLEPDGPPISPYEESLVDASIPHRQEWARRVRAQLSDRELDPSTTTFVLHTGQIYREELEPLLSAGGGTVELPVEGLEEDERMRWYTYRV